MSVNTALIRLIYPPQILGRGMGVNAMVVAVSAAAGPSIAGSILALGSWHWLFVINIPLGLAALVIGHRLLPHNPPAEKQHKFDKISAIANALTFGLLIYSLEALRILENRDFIGLQIALLAIIGTFFYPPATQAGSPHPAGRLNAYSHLCTLHRYIHHIIHGTNAGNGVLAFLYAECITL